MCTLIYNNQVTTVQWDVFLNDPYNLISPSNLASCVHINWLTPILLNFDVESLSVSNSVSNTNEILFSSIVLETETAKHRCLKTSADKIKVICTGGDEVIKRFLLRHNDCYLQSPQTWWSPPPGCRCQLCRLQPHSWSAASWCRSRLAAVWMLPTEAHPSALSAHTPPASPYLSHRPTKGTPTVT